jgi:hypothetical protein
MDPGRVGRGPTGRAGRQSGGARGALRGGGLRGRKMLFWQFPARGACWRRMLLRDKKLERDHASGKTPSARFRTSKHVKTREKHGSGCSAQSTCGREECASFCPPGVEGLHGGSVEKILSAPLLTSQLPNNGRGSRRLRAGMLNFILRGSKQKHMKLFKGEQESANAVNFSPLELSLRVPAFAKTCPAVRWASVLFRRGRIIYVWGA